MAGCVRGDLPSAAMSAGRSARSCGEPHGHAPGQRFFGCGTNLAVLLSKGILARASKSRSADAGQRPHSSASGTASERRRPRGGRRLQAARISPRDRPAERPVELEDAGAVAGAAEATDVARRQDRFADVGELRWTVSKSVHRTAPLPGRGPRGANRPQHAAALNPYARHRRA
jgi:hypothetical protein